jgi:antitoxin VapB
MSGNKQAVSLNIKNQEVYQAASRLAKMNGVTITAAVLDAVRAELGRQERRRRGGNEILRMQEFTRRVSAMPVLDSRSDDEILGYGPEGHLSGD